MQYPLLILLNLIMLVISLFLGILIIHFSIKLFDKSAQLSKTLSAILIYFVISILIYLILDIVFSKIDLYSASFKLLTGVVANLFVFKMILKKYFNFSFGKSLLIYIIMLILFPIAYFLIFIVESNILTQQVFALEMEQLRQQIFTSSPVIFRIIAIINHGIFTAPADYLRNILVTTPSIF